jgi:pilus assembly protein CpaE
MIRTAVISSNAETLGRVKEHLDTIPGVCLANASDYYPDADVAPFLRASDPDAIILDFTFLDRAIAFSKKVQDLSPGIQIIGVHAIQEPEQLLPLLRAGARELLRLPLDPAELWEAMAHVRATIERLPEAHSTSGEVYCFLPVRGGVGATTLAANVSRSLSGFEGVNPLLIDFDLTSAMVRFLMRIHNAYTTEDALERVGDLDLKLWKRMVRNIEGLDVLHAGSLDPERNIDLGQVRSLIAFARRLNSHIVVDLSQNLEPYAQEVMRIAKRVFLVSTAETPSLYQVRRKLDYLEGQNLKDRISLVLNRVENSNPLNPAQIQQIVSIPLFATFPNDYFRTDAAITAGRVIDPGSELGQAIARFAAALAVGGEMVELPKSKKRFSFFSRGAGG